MRKGETIVFTSLLAALTLLQLNGFSHPVLWFLCGLSFVLTNFDGPKEKA